MDYYGEFEYIVPGLVEGTAGLIVGLFLIVYFLAMAVSVVSYVLGSLGSYRIAKRRGIHHAWLAWIPVGCNWLLGSTSDHYQYVVKHKVTKRRTIQLILNLILLAFSMAIGIFVAVAVTAQSNAMAIAMVVVAYFMVLALSLAIMVISYICYYDLFQSCKPGNAVLFLILGVLFPVTLPFFVFACSKHDNGMPAKRAPQRFEQVICEPAVETPVDAAEVPAEEEVPVAEDVPVVETELVEEE